MADQFYPMGGIPQPQNSQSVAARIAQLRYRKAFLEKQNETLMGQMGVYSSQPVTPQQAYQRALNENPNNQSLALEQVQKMKEAGLFAQPRVQTEMYSPTQWGTIINRRTGEEKPASFNQQQPTSQETNLTGEEYLASLPPDRAAIVKGMSEGRIPVPTGSALRNPYVSKLVSDMQRYNPKSSANAIKNIKSFDTGIEGRTVRSFNVVTDHLETLSQLASALNNGDIQAFNNIGNFFSKQTGSPSITNFETAKKIVSSEIAKALTGSSMALTDREEIAKTISSANSPQQLSGAIDSTKKLIAGQLSGLKKQYEAGTGLNDFLDKYLTPATIESLTIKSNTPTGAVRVNNDADYDALPSGAEFIDPNGQTRRKP